MTFPLSVLISRLWQFRQRSETFDGGLSEAELKAARESGFVGVRLGPRVLRTETAGIAGLAALQTLWGDLAS